ncbi:hypothetical protein D307_gp087 [Bacillus phage Bastille]|uniref:Uncharacterized protein n=1 Tax=Bacillus phage Bastille TaxID=57477 RepID=J9PLC3_9CAUD|nr:hypothetical protein D307_gp087 [Bacillus phage Bastille]AEQ34377.1 hypothetical protein [Bacillus phage Bastille]
MKSKTSRIVDGVLGLALGIGGFYKFYTDKDPLGLVCSLVGFNLVTTAIDNYELDNRINKLEEKINKEDVN